MNFRTGAWNPREEVECLDGQALSAKQPGAYPTLLKLLVDVLLMS